MLINPSGYEQAFNDENTTFADNEFLVWNSVGRWNDLILREIYYGTLAPSVMNPSFGDNFDPYVLSGDAGEYSIYLTVHPYNSQLTRNPIGVWMASLSPSFSFKAYGSGREDVILESSLDYSSGDRVINLVATGQFSIVIGVGWENKFISSSGIGYGIVAIKKEPNRLPAGFFGIEGDFSQGSTLVVLNSINDPDGLGFFNYQWSADGVPIEMATTQSYTLSQAEVGKKISVTASYIDGNGNFETVESASVNSVKNTNDKPTGNVLISGVAKQGQTLTAANTLSDLDGLGTIRYQWKANGTAINGATGLTYTLTQAEVGKTITVTASYTDGQGTAESKTSAATAAVANVNAPPSTVTINGTQGNDDFRNTAGNDLVNGGAGVDTVIYSANSAGYSLSLTANAIKLVDKTNPNAVDTLVNVEKLQFGDKVIHIASQPHDSYADLPDALYQFFVVGFGAAAGVTYMNQMAEAYRFWLPAYGEEAITKVVEAFTTKTQFTSVYPEALYREEQGRYYTYQNDLTQPGSPLVKGAEVDKSVFDAQMANLAQNLVNTIVKDSATPEIKAQAVKDVIAALNLGGEWTIGKVIYVLFGNLAGKALDDPDWGGTARQFANQVAVSKYYTDILSQSTDDVGTLREIMQGVTHHSDVSTPEKIASLIGVALMDADFV